jgi:phage portal protein BeeE
MGVWQFIGTALTEAPGIVKAFAPGDTTGEPLPDHPLVNLMKQPNDFYDGATLMQAFALDWLFSGDVYWMKVREEKYLTPVELWYIPYFMMQPLGDPENRRVFIKEYIYTVDGMRYSYPVENIVHHRRGINPRDLRRGIGVFDSVLREIYTDNMASNFAAAILKNWGVVPYVISPPRNMKADQLGNQFGGDPEAARARALEIKQQFIDSTTGDQRGKPIVNTIPLEITKLGFSPQELDISSLRKVPEARVASVSGLPAALLQFLVGLEHGTSYASYKEAREQAYESVVVPLLRTIASGVNKQLMGDFGDPKGRRLEFSFDLSGVRVLQDDQDKLYTRVSGAINAGWMLISDARSAAGLPFEETDKIYIRGGQPVKYGEEMLPPAPPAPPMLPPASEEKPAEPNPDEEAIDGEVVDSPSLPKKPKPKQLTGKKSIDRSVDIQSYLKTMVEAHGEPAEGYLYSSVDELVLSEGEAFKAGPLPNNVGDGQLGMSFMNAYRTVENHPDLTYVEGFAQMSHLEVPVYHAWTVTKEGDVVDPTWDRFRRKGETISYFGVKIPIDLVRKTILARERYGVLENHEQDYPLLKTGIFQTT